jgi:hypothetical protein
MLTPLAIKDILTLPDCGSKSFSLRAANDLIYNTTQHDYRGRPVLPFK